MHWISVVTLLGAALVPNASARPACRPDRTTSFGISTTATSVETLSTATVEPSATLTTTATDESTTNFQTAVTSSGTATLDSTILISTTVADTTSSEATTTQVQTTSAAEVVTTIEAATTTAEATTTTSADAGPTTYIRNSGFESHPNTVWNVQNGEIKDTELAHTGTHFLQFELNNAVTRGQFQVGQSMAGLATDVEYQFQFYATMFSSPTPVKNRDTTCGIMAIQDDTIIGTQRLDFDNLDSYQPYGLSFYPVNSDFTFTLALQCNPGQAFTFAMGIDDVTISPVGS